MKPSREGEDLAKPSRVWGRLRPQERDKTRRMGRSSSQAISGSSLREKLAATRWVSGEWAERRPVLKDSSSQPGARGSRPDDRLHPASVHRRRERGEEPIRAGACLSGSSHPHERLDREDLALLGERAARETARVLVGDRERL